MGKRLRLLGPGDATNGGASAGTISAGLLVSGDAIITGNLGAGLFGGFSRSLFDAGSSLNAFGEVGYRMETVHAAFEPFAGLAHMHMKTDSFTETDVDLGPMTASARGSLG